MSFLLRFRSARTRARADFLDKVVPKNAVAAEIGVYKGKFTKLIMEFARPRKLHLIDPWWMLGAKEWRWAKGNRSVFDAYIGIIRSFEDDLVSGRVVLNVGFDLEVLPSFPDDYFDWVYLDSTHEYEDTRRELRLLKDKVKATGLIAGDDWKPDPADIHHGVYRAVNEFLETQPYVIAYLDEEHAQWCIKKKEASVS